MSLQPDRDPFSSPNESSFGSRVYELGEQVESLRNRAELLGMFGGMIIFSMTRDSSEELRIAGRPIRLERVKTKRPLLSLTINQYIKPHPQQEELHTVFAEEFIIDERSLSFTPDLVQFQPEDLNRRSDTLAPVIWRNIQGDWQIYRGQQKYFVPHTPLRTKRGDSELYAKQQQADYLTGLLSGVTPGCEDGRYEEW